MTEKEIIMFILVGNSFIFSLFSFLFALKCHVSFEARDQSTHTIEFRDPDKIYEDELVLQKDTTGVISRKDIHSDEMGINEEHIDLLNKQIDEGKVLL